MRVDDANASGNGSIRSGFEPGGKSPTASVGGPGPGGGLSRGRKPTGGVWREACVVRTRIPVWLLVQARRLGTSDIDILRSFPTLRVEDLANAWAYARSHAEEIDRQIRDNEAA